MRNIVPAYKEVSPYGDCWEKVGRAGRGLSQGGGFPCTTLHYDHQWVIWKVPYQQSGTLSPHTTGSLEPIFSNFDVIENHVGILLKLRFWSCRSGVGAWESAFLTFPSSSSTEDLLAKQNFIPHSDPLNQDLHVNKSSESHTHGIKVWDMLPGSDWCNPAACCYYLGC